MLLLCAATGCAAKKPQLDGTWILSSVDSTPVEKASEKVLPFFKIEGDNIEGFDGCNHFFGPITQPGAISSTRMACPDTSDLLPLDLNNVGQHLAEASVDETSLNLPAFGDYPTSAYIREKPSTK